MKVLNPQSYLVEIAQNIIITISVLSSIFLFTSGLMTDEEIYNLYIFHFSNQSMSMLTMPFFLLINAKPFPDLSSLSYPLASNHLHTQNSWTSPTSPKKGTNIKYTTPIQILPKHSCYLPCSDPNTNVIAPLTKLLRQNMNLPIPFPTQRSSSPPNIWGVQGNRKSIKVWPVMTPRDIIAHARVLPPSNSTLCLGSYCLAVCWLQALSYSQSSLIVCRAGQSCQSAIHILYEEEHCTWHFFTFSSSSSKNA